MVTALYEDEGATNFEARPQLTAYKYDQLNRIAGMMTYNQMELPFNSWNEGSLASESNYHTSYAYDAMGNILSLNRQEHDGSDLDELVYEYSYDGYGFLENNRLLQVDDNGNITPSLTDFEGSSTYTYDAIGNLISDSGEEIAEILWTVTGKVKSVTRSAGSTNSDLEFAYDAMGNRISKTERKRDANGQTGETKTTYYQRDASGNVMATYYELQGSTTDGQYLDELNIFGSSRIGMLKVNKKLVDLPDIDLTTINNTIISGPMQSTYTRGTTYFELSNHLGNVLAVVTDRKLAVDDGGTGVAFYLPDMVSATDYYPFGFAMEGRGFSSDNYRYGFNGMEKDNELKGSGNSYDFGVRLLDVRLGRWLAVDNEFKEYQSNYLTFSNSPLIIIDPDGNDDYYYDKTTKAYSVIRVEGAPHRFYITTDPVPIEGGGFLSSYRIANFQEIGNMLNDRNKLFQDAAENASSYNELSELYMASYKDACQDNWKVAAVTFTVPLAIITGGELLTTIPIVSANAQNFVMGQLINIEMNTGNVSLLLNASYEIGSSRWFPWVLSGIAAVTDPHASQTFNADPVKTVIIQSSLHGLENDFNNLKKLTEADNIDIKIDYKEDEDEIEEEIEE